MSAHHDGERPDFCGPEYIRIARCLGASFDDTLMNGPELVHVIALVGSAARIQKGKQAGNQQRGFVMRNGVRPGEYCTCFTVETATVGKEYGVFR